MMTRTMIAPDLPAGLKAALDARLHGLSRTDAAQRSAAISQAYRNSAGSGAIRTERDALAYALARMPATYAAVTASFNAVRGISPDFAPLDMLDVGAGPGTATWAAAEAFPSLTSFALFDENTALRTLALELALGSRRLSEFRYQLGDARTRLAEAAPADLVVASYVVNELDAAERLGLTDLMWTRTRGLLLVVEPGTPAGYAGIIDLRRHLIAQGAHVAAPCPHDAECPLVRPDWCHFVQRLPRSRAHKQLKGAELPYEDEKFIYAAFAREAVARPAARVLASPEVSKVAVTAKLCTPEGLVIAELPRRTRQDYARARRWRWGDAVMEERQP